MTFLSAAGAVASQIAASSESSTQATVADPLLGEPYQVRYIDTEATSNFPSYHAALVTYPFGSSAQKSAQLADSTQADSTKTASQISNDSIQAPAQPKGSILYIHGFNDYFMQSEMAAKLDSAGYAFYAIDLHKYGRAYREGERRGELLDIAEYYAELDSCMSAIKSEHPEAPVALMGHSTGGLIAVMYAANRNDGKELSGVILNSPFLEMNFNFLALKLVLPVISFAGKYFPNIEIPRSGNTNYGESLHKDYRGEWDYSLDLKALGSIGVNAGWTRAIHVAQDSLQDGLNIQAPILLMHSGCSVDEKEWVDDYTRCDGVLNIEHIKKYGATLGPKVTDAEIPGGLHDLVLSPKPARDSAYSAILQFLNK